MTGDSKKISELDNEPVEDYYRVPVAKMDPSGNGMETIYMTVEELKETVNGWIKYTVSYADFQPNASPNGTIEIGTDIIPAGGTVTGIKLKHSAAFTGGAIAAAQVYVYSDDTGPTQAYHPYLNVFQVPSNTIGESFTGCVGAPSQNGVIPNHASASKMYMELNTAGGDIDALTAGSIDVWIKTEIVV